MRDFAFSPDKLVAKSVFFYLLGIYVVVYVTVVIKPLGLKGGGGKVPVKKMSVDGREGQNKNSLSIRKNISKYLLLMVPSGFKIICFLGSGSVINFRSEFPKRCNANIFFLFLNFKVTSKAT
jgi:hypothetical protein